MSEASFRQTIREKLSPFGAIKRVENAVDVGFPDSLYCLTFAGLRATGLLEFKVAEFPKKAITAVVVESLTDDQCRWHEEWVAAGGSAFTLLRIGRVVALLDAPLLRLIYVRRVSVEDVKACALVWRASSPFPTGAILRALTRPP